MTAALEEPPTTDVVTWPVHPAGDLFPQMSGDELIALAKDIRYRGLRDPVWLYADPDRGTVLLDGRSRVAACRLAGVPVDFQFYTGDDPIGFSVAQHVELSGLTTGQRCAIAIRLHPLYQSDAALWRARHQPFTHRTRRDRTALDRAAASVGTSGRSAAYFRRLAADHPDLGEQVASGQIHLHEALNTARNRQAAIPAAAGEATASATPPARRQSARTGTKTYYSRSDVVTRDAASTLVHALAGFEIGLRTATAIDPTITAGEAARWAGDLSTAIRCLRKLVRMFEERTQ